MDTGIFIALINPGIALTFAATFLLLWNYQREKRYILLLSASLAAGAGGFLLQYFLLPNFGLTRLLSNTLFLVAGVGLSISMLGRYNRRLPVRDIMVVWLAGVATYVWYLYGDPNTEYRIYAINFTFGTLTLLIAAELRAVRTRKAVDNIMLFLTVFWGLSFFVRPVVSLWLEDVPVNDVNYHQSIYWYTLTFFCSMFILLISLSSTCALVLDIMDDLNHQSQTDLLSGLLNRRGFEKSAEQKLREAQGSGLPMALLVCDLDHFKAVNDTYGHATGDSVIRIFAERLRTGTSGDHIVGRMGGEEFAVLLCGSDLRAARLFAEGIRTTFSTAPCVELPDGLRTTASFGIAQWLAGETAEQLFLRADRALYAAKNSGRNCVRVAELPPDPVHDASRAKTAT